MPNQSPVHQQCPTHATFQQLLIPYLGPYFIYVALSSLPDGFIAPGLSQLLKLVATVLLMGIYFRTYRFGRLTAGNVMVSLLAFPVALVAWLGMLLLIKWMGVADGSENTAARVTSDLYFWVRLFNSVVLVAVFEELLMRVYVMQWLFQADGQREKKGILSALLDTLELHPIRLTALPLSRFSVIGATLVFTAGHHLHEYPAAIAYFLFTTWLYKKTGSLWVCILVHGLTNLAIGLLVRYAGMGWLW